MGTSKTVARLRAVREAVGRTGEGEESPEAGFTLIELMVVLLIMGILLAIAIPTFLGVTGSAHAAATKTNISSAMTEAVASYTSNSAFTTGTGTTTEVAALSKETHAMSFTTSASAGQATISVDVAGNTTIVMAAAQPSTKVCWMEITNDSSTAVAGATSGTWYYGFKYTTATPCIATHAVTKAEWAKAYPKVS